jgi:hypothetical protein
VPDETVTDRRPIDADRTPPGDRSTSRREIR